MWGGVLGLGRIRGLVLLGPTIGLTTRDAVADCGSRAGDHRRAGYSTDESHCCFLSSGFEGVECGHDRFRLDVASGYELPARLACGCGERKRPQVLVHDQ